MDAPLRTPSPSKTGLKARRANVDSGPTASGGATSNNFRSRGFLGLTLFVIFIMMYWRFLHRSLLHIEVQSEQRGSSMGGLSSTSRETLSHPDPIHVKNLLDETKALLQDVVRANMTLNSHILADLESIREEI